MSGYSYNRHNFSWTRTELVWTYCRCVTLELALKEELSLLTSSNNGGHDLPTLLASFANGTLSPSPLRSQIITLSTHLAADLGALWSQGKDGQATKVRANCYPYIRYLRHQSDGWTPQHSSDADLQKLAATVDQLFIALRSAGITL